MPAAGDAHASSAIQIRILSLAQKKKRDKNIISHHSIISKKILVANCINLSALSAALQSPNGSQKEKASETQNEIHATRTGNKFLVPLPPGILIVRQGEIRVDTFLLLGLCLLAAAVLLTVLPPFLPSSSGCPPRNATQVRPPIARRVSAKSTCSTPNAPPPPTAIRHPPVAEPLLPTGQPPTARNGGRRRAPPAPDAAPRRQPHRRRVRPRCVALPPLPFPSLPCSFSPAVSFRSATPPAVLSAANRLSFRLNDSRRRIREWIGKGLLAPARGSVGRCCVWLIATLSFRFIYFYYSTLSTSMSVLCQRQDLVKLFVFFFMMKSQTPYY